MSVEYHIVISEKRDLEETRALTIALLNRLYTVLHEDWDYSAGCLSDEWRRFYIHPQGTFLEPFPAVEGVPQEDESNNWANRGALLQAYRALCDHLDCHPSEW